MNLGEIFQNVLRMGTIESCNYSAQTCQVRMYDRLENRTITCALPQSAIGNDAGLFMHPEKGSLVVIGWGYWEKPYIVSYVPNTAFGKDFTDSSNAAGIASDAFGYPALGKGDVALAGGTGSKVLLEKNGNISIETSNVKQQLNRQLGHLSSGPLSISTTEAVYSYSGAILRDRRVAPGATETSMDKRTSLSFVGRLNPIGRDPNEPIVAIGSETTGYRNPPLVEERRIYTEFAHSFGVGTVDEEKANYQSAKVKNNKLIDTDLRPNTAYDVLNLNPDNPNILFESVIGTVVDIYGNIVDLNRNKLVFNNEAKLGDRARLAYLSDQLRRSIKVHYELNAKKLASGHVSTSLLGDDDLGVGTNHSRWSLDVDGEGLTKINIPASSNTGNIPVLARYVNGYLASDKKTITEMGQPKRPEKDIFHMGFGQGDGILIPAEYAPEDVIQGNGKIPYRTAYHDIQSTAKLARKPLLNLKDSEIPDAGPALVAVLKNSFTDGSQANAGGRSLFANLDGSIELNIGRDNVDNKSIVLDAAGGIISRIGSMKDSSLSASVISQLDGSVYIQIGDDAGRAGNQSSLNVVEDPTLRIVVKGSLGTDEIIIDKKYLKIRTGGGGVGKDIILESSRNIVLSAEGGIYLMGRTIGLHGEVDSDGNINSGPERVFKKSGKEI
jgi:hypothetical protein